LDESVVPGEFFEKKWRVPEGKSLRIIDAEQWVSIGEIYFEVPERAQVILQNDTFLTVEVEQTSFRIGVGRGWYHDIEHLAGSVGGS
jgi:hypothetical protein